MIKATISANLPRIYEFVDNRLIPHMAQRKLNQFHSSIATRLLKFTHGVVQDVDDIAFYLEKAEQKGTLILTVSEKVGGEKPKMRSYGLALRAKPDNTTELFIDRLAQAYEKSLLPYSKTTKKRMFGIVIAVFAVIALAFFVIFPPFIFVLIFAVFAYPFHYLKQKREFKRTQKQMEAVVAIFRDEFGVLSQADSNDWITLWGQIKSKTPGMLIDAVSPI